MVTSACSSRCVIQSIYLFFCLSTILGMSPRAERVELRHVTRKHPTIKRQEDYIKHWKLSRDQVSADYQPAHSDAMLLYSIGAGELVMVETIGKSWDNEYKLSAKNEKSGKQHKFVTETISYGMLKIRSEENKMYICARSNGNIIFKSSADKMSSADQSKRPRKRCLFKWSFTEEKHIQLSITSSRVKWFLTVKEGVVKLLHQNDSTAKERSFIWLPTRSAHSRAMNYNPKRYIPHARGFPLMKPDDCGYYERHAHQQKSRKIKDLSEEIKKLQQEVEKLKWQANLNTVVSKSKTLKSGDAR